jgi:inner membrane protease subunit 1
MLPTFEIVDEVLLISRWHRHGRSVQVGDLVVYKIPIEPNADGVKRVIGLPGDYVLIDSPESRSHMMIQVSSTGSPLDAALLRYDPLATGP